MVMGFAVRGRWILRERRGLGGGGDERTKGIPALKPVGQAGNLVAGTRTIERPESLVQRTGLGGRWVRLEHSDWCYCHGVQERLAGETCSAVVVAGR